MTAPAAASARPGRRVAHGARAERAGGGAPAARSRRGRSRRPDAGEARGEQHDAHHGAGEHDEARGDAGAADERDAGDEQAGDRHEHDAGRGERRVARGRVGPARRLERVVPGPQLLLLARGEQQRVVDPRPEAEHAGQGGREPGDIDGGRRPHQRAEAQPEPRERGAERVARRTEVAQHGEQQHDRDHEPDHLADREPAGGGAVDRLAGHGDVDPGSVEAGGGVLEPLARRGVEILGGAVVGDRGERRPRSSEMWPAVSNGSSTETTCGCLAIAASAARISRSPRGRAIAPSPALNTRVAWVPDSAGKRCSSRSWARWDSMPGTVKSSLKAPPTAIAPPIRAMTASRIASVAAGAAAHERRE